jgi:Response regulator containing a CheY-like receiver domain and an HTH DNA-binding domain
MRAKSASQPIPDREHSRGDREDRIIRVLLLADDRITRAGLRSLIDQEPGMCVVGEHELVDDPGTVLSIGRPHIVLVDVDRHTRDFAPPLIARLCKKTRVIVVTSAHDPEMVSAVFCSGAKGLVRKDQTPTLLLKAIRRVDAGEVWLDRLMMARLLSELSRRGGAFDAPEISRLTIRERQLISIVGNGFANSEIADRLRISEATVRNHLTSIFKKLELHSRFELVMYALRQGLIKAPISRPRPAHATNRGHRRIKSAS